MLLHVLVVVVAPSIRLVVVFRGAMVVAAIMVVVVLVILIIPTRTINVKYAASLGTQCFATRSVSTKTTLALRRCECCDLFLFLQS
jgi:hypothetical protein